MYKCTLLGMPFQLLKANISKSHGNNNVLCGQDEAWYEMKSDLRDFVWLLVPG